MINENDYSKNIDNLNKVPEEIKKRSIYCLVEPVTSNGKVSKRPYNPETNKYIDVRNCGDNTDCFLSMEDAKKHLSPYLHSELAIAMKDSICAIELDQCINGNGQFSKEADSIMSIMNAYTEITPGGTGLRILFKASGFLLDESQYNISNPAIGLEVYIEGHTDKCATITGDTLTPGAELEERGAELQTILDLYLKKPVKNAAISPSAQNPTSTAPGNAPGQIDNKEIIKMAGAGQGGENFYRLMNINLPPNSIPDIREIRALLFELAFWSRKNPKQMDEIFRMSGLMWPGWDMPDQQNPGKTFGEVAIQDIIQSTKDVYDRNSYALNKADNITVHTRSGPIKLSDLHPEFSSSTLYRKNDIGCARLFADCYRDKARYVVERKQWYIYDGKRWQGDNMKAMELAKELTTALHAYALGLPISNGNMRDSYITFTSKLLNRRARENLLKDASSVYPIKHSEFDKDPYVLNCLNGTLNLHTGELKPHNPGDLLSKLANVEYHPGVHSQRWEQHIKEIMDDDAEKAEYLQKAMGYGLTGDTRFECFFILFGPTSRNGKGTTMEAYMKILGDYGRAARPETIAQKQTSRGSGPSEDIARLAGARVVNISEPDQKMVLSSALVKTLTGNDTITARFLNENSFEYRPQYKLMINTNYLPKTSDITVFRSGRVKVIPFEHQFTGSSQNTNLKQELQAPESLTGILNWCIEGLQLLETNGFDMPKSVKDAVSQYEKDSDKIARFIEEKLTPYSAGEIPLETLYNMYQSWCNSNGQFPEGMPAFKQSMGVHAEVKRKRPRDKDLGTNPRSLVLGYQQQPQTC